MRTRVYSLLQRIKARCEDLDEMNFLVKIDGTWVLFGTYMQESIDSPSLLEKPSCHTIEDLEETLGILTSVLYRQS